MTNSEENFTNVVLENYRKGTLRTLKPRKEYYEEREYMKEHIEKNRKKTNNDYELMKKKSVSRVGGLERIVTRKKEAVVIYIEELCHYLDQIHKETGHGGRDRMLHRAKELLLKKSSY